MADYFAKAASLAQSASRMTTQLTSSLADRTRALASDSTAAKYLDTPEQLQRIPELRTALESGVTSQQLDALKRVIAAISRGISMQALFPSIVKLVASRSIDVCRLVYMYLLRYAEDEPDLALLSINTFQKDLQHTNPFIRAMALRVLSGIRVPLVGHLVVLGIRQGSTDISPYVRKSAAYAIIKTYTYDQEQASTLISLLEILLNDRSPLVIGASVVVLQRMDLPDTTRIIHPYFRKLCHALADTDAAGQVAIMEVLTEYSRTQFTQPESAGEAGLSPAQAQAGMKASMDAFYGESGKDGSDGKKKAPPQGIISPDLLLLLASTTPLLHHHNAAVVIAAVSLLYHLGSSDHWALLPSPLLRLLGGEKELSVVVLVNILTLARALPALFLPHLNRFFLSPGDPVHIAALRMEILLVLFRERDYPREKLFMEEMRVTCMSPSCEIAAIGVRTLVAWSTSTDDVILISRCFAALVHILRSGCPALYSTKPEEGLIPLVETTLLGIAQLGEVLLSKGKTLDAPILRDILQAYPAIRRGGTPHAILHLASLPWSRETEEDERAILEVIQLSIMEFEHLDGLSKEEAILLTIKYRASHPDHPALGELLTSIMELARFDPDFAIRDVARTYQVYAQAVDAHGKDSIEAELTSVILSSKPPPSWVDPISPKVLDSEEQYTVGSLSLFRGRRQVGYAPLPPWTIQASDPALRDAIKMDPRAAPVRAVRSANSAMSSSTSNSTATSTPGSSKGRWGDARHLDAFFGEPSSLSTDRVSHSAGVIGGRRLTRDDESSSSFSSSSSEVEDPTRGDSEESSASSSDSDSNSDAREHHHLVQ